MFARMLLVLSLALCSSTMGFSQKPADSKQPAPKEAPSKQPIKGYLPNNWAKLGLSDEQKQNVYKIQNKYRAQIKALEKQIEELKSKMASERYEVLSEEQKKQLDMIIKGKLGGL